MRFSLCQSISANSLVQRPSEPKVSSTSHMAGAMGPAKDYTLDSYLQDIVTQSVVYWRNTSADCPTDALRERILHWVEQVDTYTCRLYAFETAMNARPTTHLVHPRRGTTIRSILTSPSSPCAASCADSLILAPCNRATLGGDRGQPLESGSPAPSTNLRGGVRNVDHVQHVDVVETILRLILDQMPWSSEQKAVFRQIVGALPMLCTVVKSWTPVASAIVRRIACCC